MPLVSSIDSIATRVAHRTASTTELKIDLSDQFLRRWSPRAMSGEPVNTGHLTTLLEAARWAPSCYNAQPWHMLFSHRGDPYWQDYLTLLVEPNQAWAQQAGALIVLLGRRNFEHNNKPNPSYQLDTGAAWMSMALQASDLGLVIHAMQGFNADAARELLQIPEEFVPMIMIALGHPGEINNLPPGYADKESPSTRKPITEFASQGKWR